MTVGPLLPFEEAMRRDFGAREEFRACLLHALRRAGGGVVSLTCLADGSLRLYTMQGGDAPPGTALVSIRAPDERTDEALLALRLDVIDRRAVAHRYAALAGT